MGIMALDVLIREGIAALRLIEEADLTIHGVKPLSSCSLQDGRISRQLLEGILLSQDKLAILWMHLDTPSNQLWR